jgi:hypothetical protein
MTSPVPNNGAGRELCRLMAGRMQRASANRQTTMPYRVICEMAARIGLMRKMVYRALYSFSDKKLIEVTRTEFVLTDREGLVQLVERG